MSLLTDDEIEALAMDDDGSDDLAFARAVEAAILAKLASAELPEPEQMWLPTQIAEVYTADQLRQAYAQGAAAQLSAEPVTVVGCDDYTKHPNTGTCATLENPLPTGTPLYTRRQA